MKKIIKEHFEKIKEAEENLKNKEYIPAIYNFTKAKSVGGLIKVINAIEKRREMHPFLAQEVPNSLSLYRYDALVSYKYLTGVSY